jgi:hypothetical protein
MKKGAVRMYLLKSEIEKHETVTQVEFEKVTADVLMISVDYDVNDKSRVFSYWRLLGTGTNPPLEIGVNSLKRSIKSANFFVDSDCFKEIRLGDINTLYGNIMVDTKLFAKKNDYIDTPGKYFIFASNRKLLCIFDSNNCIKETIGNDRVKFLVNYNHEICGFEIHNLNEREIEDLKSIQ